MYRCPNSECRSRRAFSVNKIGYKCTVVVDSNLQSHTYTEKLGKSGKRPEEVLNYKMKCCTCNHTATVKEFIEAYHNPMKLFDTSNLCDCGGEIWQDIVYVKPEIELAEEFAGDQRRVSQHIKNVLKCDKCGKEYASERES